MKRNRFGNLENFHDAAATALVFLSMLLSIFVFGIVFLPRPAALVYEKYNNFLAQVSVSPYQPSKSTKIYSRPKFVYRYPDNLSAEISRVLSQLSNLNDY